jgi:peptidoglycan/xylan/chitin deacetylase (PgdA/CDA1 family)
VIEITVLTKCVRIFGIPSSLTRELNCDPHHCKEALSNEKNSFDAPRAGGTMLSFGRFSARWLWAPITCLTLLHGRLLLQAQAIPILAYHRFDPSMPGPTTVRTSAFESQLKWLDDHHYQVLPLHSAIDKLRGRGDHPPALAVVITVDDGHRSVYTEMFPLLLKHHIPVTLFIYPSAISNASYALTWEQIRQMQKSSLVDIQSHTFWHPNFHRERARLSDAEYKAFVSVQLTRSRKILQDRLGQPVNALAWPYGIYDPYLEEAARQTGYEAAFAYEGGPARAGCDMFAIPRIPVSDGDTGARFSELLIESRTAGKKE